jgi:hypothetical protein
MTIKLKIDYKNHEKLKIFCERRIRGLNKINDWREQQIKSILKGTTNQKINGKIIKKKI